MKCSMKNKQKVIEGIVWNDHAGYGMCLLPKGPSVPGDAIIIESEGKQLLPNEWHGMKVRLTIEVINDYVSPEHKKFYDHDRCGAALATKEMIILMYVSVAKRMGRDAFA